MGGGYGMSVRILRRANTYLAELLALSTNLAEAGSIALQILEYRERGATPPQIGCASSAPRPINSPSPAQRLCSLQFGPYVSCSIARQAARPGKAQLNENVARSVGYERHRT